MASNVNFAFTNSKQPSCELSRPSIINVDMSVSDVKQNFKLPDASLRFVSKAFVLMEILKTFITSSFDDESFNTTKIAFSRMALETLRPHHAKRRMRASVNIPYIITSRANLVNSNETMMQREKSANKSTGEQIKHSLLLSSSSDPSYCVNHNLSRLPVLHQKHDVCLCVYSIGTGLVYVLLLRVKTRQ